MDRNLSSKNTKTALAATALGFVMFGLAFVAAALYVS